MIILIFGLALILFAGALIWVSLADDHKDMGVNRSLAAIEAITRAPATLRDELDQPFGERVLEPLMERVQALGRRLTGADAQERYRQKLDLAGNPSGWTIDRIVTSKLIGAFAGGSLGMLFSQLGGTSVLLALGGGLVGALAGFFGADMWLYQMAHERQESITRNLPDAIDLLTISVESGLGFDAALQQVARNTDGPLAAEFARVLREMQIGLGRSESMTAMAERTKSADLQAFIGALVQADGFGIPIGQVLRVQSSEMRVKRRQYAEEKAQKVPVKITVPMIFCILPCLFVVVLGPAAITIATTF